MDDQALIARSEEVSDWQVGGVPVGTSTFEWPNCVCCNGPMQFVAQARLAKSDSDQLLLLFQCQNDPGMCDDWDAEGGGNAAMFVATGDAEIARPSEGVTKLDEQAFLTLRSYPESADGNPEPYEVLLEKDSSIVGKLGGSPAWIQDDETPSCQCGKPMDFVLQLEEFGCGLNFGGGGVAYAFACGDCDNQARFLWQS